VPLEAGFFPEETIQELAGASHEWPPLDVLFPPGSLADNHEGGVRVALAEYDGGPPGS
jgi:hypothetical protein